MTRTWVYKSDSGTDLLPDDIQNKATESIMVVLLNLTVKFCKGEYQTKYAER